MNPAQFASINSNFQEMTYRPLYYYGLGSSAGISTTESLASLPTTSNGGKTVTFVIKTGKKWSNGDAVTGKQVIFWINMAKAHPGDYGGYVPGIGIPDTITAASASGNTVHITFNAPVNNTWVLANALAEITPMPSTWDITHLGGAKGSAGCEGNAVYKATAPYQMNTALAGTLHVFQGCNSAFNVLSNNGGGNGDVSTLSPANFGSTSIWRISDGPWKLGTVADDSVYGGNVMPSFVPNTAYVGPQHATVANLKFKFFATSASEVTSLQTYSDKLATGAVPGSYVQNALPPSTPGGPPRAPTTANLDSNINHNYKVEVGSLWGFQYAYWIFKNTAPHHALVNQLYIRQALQLGIDQKGIVTTVNHGYATPTCNPEPTINDPYNTTTGCPMVTNTYAANVTAAKALLTAHHWNVSTNPATCSLGGATGCGSGISTGAHLTLQLTYTFTGNTASTRYLTVQNEILGWNAMHIQVTEDRQSTAGNTFGVCAGGTTDICWYGGWVYNPGAFPSGEQLLLSHAPSNVGGFSNATVDADIRATIKTGSAATIKAAMLKYAKDAGYATEPVLFQPLNLGSLEVNRHLAGIGLLSSPLAALNPEYITIGAGY
jgi:peptide/nickel transport system substrate-binding protein